ncbi:MAG: restriction endonuclease subunit S [Tenacibaculum sp.]
MANSRDNPEVRFADYTENWVEKELDKLADFSKGKGYSKNDLLEDGNPIILYGRLYTNYETVIKNVDTFANLKEDSVFSKGGEVIVPSSGETQEDIVRASVVEKEKIILGGDLNIITPKEDLNSTFLALTISNGKVYKDLVKKAQGKSVVHIRNSDLQETLIPYSKDKTEQSQIGNFFQNLDQLITQHQQKLTKLKILKKAMLDKMFPKDGAAVPEIRFKGFTGDWEEVTIDNLAVISTGFPFDSKKFHNEGELLVITNGNIQSESRFVDSSVGNRINIDDEIPNNYVLNIDDILVTMDGTVGRTAKVICEKQILAQRVGRLKAKVNSDFLYYLLNTGGFFKDMTMIAIGGTIKHISLSDISSYQNLVPKSKDEQEKIGHYFKNLDALIKNNNEQLTKLQNLKKACLTKMFV